MLVKTTAAALFNTRGLNVTLRDIAADLHKSYGNITYHCTSKEALLIELHTMLQAELDILSQQLRNSQNLLQSFTEALRITYATSRRYRFV